MQSMQKELQDKYKEKWESCLLYTSTKREIERLLAGEEIVKEIRQELTYQETVSYTHLQRYQ